MEAMTHLENVSRLTISTTIGINLWLDPQISEHCPKYSPGRWPINFTWLRRPGTASALTPKDGTVQECRTSADEINIRTWVWTGTTVRLSTSRSRNMLSVNSLVGIIYASNSRFVPSPTDQKSLYSYLQYHWCPIVLRVSEESTDSSNIYRSNSEGKAICNNKMAGIIVQTHSTICISSKPILMCLPIIIITIIIPTNLIMNTKIRLMKSWSCVNSSIRGEFESWKFNWDQVLTLLQCSYDKNID